MPTGLRHRDGVAPTAPRPKVFGIGLNKTGTSTLGDCLISLGYRHTSFSPALLEGWAGGRVDDLFAVADRHDSAEDWPWPLAFRELDGRYPGSRFVLTRRRDAATWLDSLVAHAARHPGNRWRFLAYGVREIRGHEAQLLDRYECHLATVRAHFADRPDDLLEVCWEEGHAWPELCGFLGEPVPDIPFPHANARPRRTAAPER